jgi:hypothetical protein
MIPLIQQYWPALAFVAYGLCLVGTHVKGPVGDVCKWLLAGKLVKPPQV